MNGLPESWLAITLGEVIDYANNTTVQPKDMEPSALLVELEDIERDTSKLTDRKTVADRNPKSTKNRFREGQILYGKLRPYLNKIIRADQDGYCSSEIIAISPGMLDGDYLFYALKSPLFIKHVNEVSHGMGMPRLGTQQAKSAPFILAPLQEQTRIAQKLDELLTQVDTLKARIDAIPTLLKCFRQSILAAAVSGRLTNEWREAVPNASVVGIPSEKEINLGEIKAKEKYLNAPTTWQWMKFGAAVSLINGDRGKNYPNKSEYVEQGIPFINTGHIDPNGMLSADRMNFITKKKFDSLGGGKIKSGDLVYCLRGATMGKTAFVNPLTVGAIASSLVIIRTKSLLLPGFSYLFLTSPQGKNLITRFDNGSAQPNLSAGSLSSYPIALPPLAEQTEIVRRVEQLFAFADNLEAQIAAAKSRIDHLTQSILAKAFRGELVPQDPNDEPASVLLERIKAQRAAAPKAKRSRKTSA